MRIKSLKVLSVLLVTVLASGCAGYIRSEVHEEALQERETQIQKLESRNDQLEGKVKELQTRLSHADTKLEGYRRKLDRKNQLLDKRTQKLKSNNEELEQELSQIKETKAKLEGRNVVLTLPEQILFDLGEAKLHEKAKESLQQLGEVLRNHPKRFAVVQGHADTIPITSTWRYSSNWDLSAMRASNVVEFLVENTKVNSERIIAAGYGDQHPVASNATEEGRRKNRRVEVVLYPPELDRRELEFGSDVQ